MHRQGVAAGSATRGTKTAPQLYSAFWCCILYLIITLSFLISYLPNALHGMDTNLSQLSSLSDPIFLTEFSAWRISSNVGG